MAFSAYKYGWGISKLTLASGSVEVGFGAVVDLSVSEWTVLVLGQLKGAVATMASSSAGSTEDDASSKAPCEG